MFGGFSIGRIAYFEDLLYGTKSVILNKTPCKDGNTRFTTVPLKPLLINNVEDIVVFLSLKVHNSNISEKFSRST